MVETEQPREVPQSSSAKYEYVDGLVYYMSGGTLAHARIGSNVVRALEDSLDSKACYVYNSDACVRVSGKCYIIGNL